MFVGKIASIYIIIFFMGTISMSMAASAQTMSSVGMAGNMEIARILSAMEQMKASLSGQLADIRDAQNEIKQRVYALENCVMECRLKVRRGDPRGLTNFSYTPWRTSCQHPYHMTVNEFAIEMRCRR